ncbi:DNA primase [Duganella sp. FT27W]|uniref:DNA primase n=1 Tax=Duganella sp. FT27W TaxID=2654636 RepID=UPI00128B9764|nr:DNA primase [Duganella sp. FT27W]MPQ56327.1 DNA primase [Duganella sp. FT27W]
MTSVHISRRGGSDELQEVLATIDIEAWMDREGIKYRNTRGSRGAQLNVKECPCCGNTNYKVYINASSGLGNCFVGDCEVKFNKWKFISATLGGSTREAIEHVKAVAREQGWRPPRKAAAVSVVRGDLTLPESVPLPHGGRNLKYLDNRNIGAEIAAYFELRMSVRGKFDYLTEDGDPMSQDYANRVIIPIFDLEGKLVSFQGRDITGTADKKYLFPPGFASTGEHLYNGHNAIGAEHVVIGEGVFDVAAIKVALDQDVNLREVVPVGGFGKNLSVGDEKSQLAKLMRLRMFGLKIITIMWDGEARALQDAVRTALMLKSVGFIARVAVLPKDKDPNEVTAVEVRNAFYRAEAVTPALATKLLLARR